MGTTSARTQTLSLVTFSHTCSGVWRVVPFLAEVLSRKATTAGAESTTKKPPMVFVHGSYHAAWWGGANSTLA